MLFNLKNHKNFFTKQSSLQVNSTKASFMVSYQIFKSNKPFSNGQLVKQCMFNWVSKLFSKVKSKFESILLLRRTLLMLVELISKELTEQLSNMFKYFVWH